MTCPIDGCPLQTTGLGLCAGHWKLVPRPIQSEIYQLVKRHKGGPAHLQAVRRACIAVHTVLDVWKRDAPAARTVNVPYRDD